MSLGLRFGFIEVDQALAVQFNEIQASVIRDLLLGPHERSSLIFWQHEVFSPVQQFLPVLDTLPMTLPKFFERQ